VNVTNVRIVVTIAALSAGCMVHGDSVDGIPMRSCDDTPRVPQCESQPDSIIGAGPTLAHVQGTGRFHSGFLDGTTLVVGATTGVGPDRYARGAIFAIDLTDGSRHLVAGSFADAAIGVSSTGGTTFGPVYDVQRGPMESDGSRVWYANSASGLLRVDGGGATSVLWNGGRVCDGDPRPVMPLDATLAVGDNGRIYVTDLESRIVEFDVDGDRCRVVSSAIIGGGPTLHSVFALRFETGALWALDTDSLFRIDPATGVRVRVSSASATNEVGGGDRVFGYRRLDVSEDAVWAVGTSAPFVRIDPASGDREASAMRTGPSGGLQIDGVWRMPGTPLVFASAGPGIIVMNVYTACTNWLSR
jgi:hypothetical protein